MFEPQGSNGPSALTDFPREVYMSFRSHVWGAAFGVAGLALFFGGGSSSTAPVSLNDPGAPAPQLAALDSAFAPPVVARFPSPRSSIPPPAPGGPAPLGAPRTGRSQAAPQRYAMLATQGRTLQQVVPIFASLGATSIFPDTLLGAVFSWDPSTHSYFRSSKTGGPPNGIRFLLYAINPLTDEPSTPLTQVGYVDLLDLSSGGTASIEIKVTDGSITYLDYTFTGSGTSASFMATVTGTITNGLAGSANKTLTFSLSITGNTSSVTLTSTYTLNNPAVTVQETVTILDDGATTTLTINFTFTRTGETIQLSGTLSASDATGDGTINLTFKVNGSTFATITGSISNPVLARPGGGQLTADELNALIHVLVASEDVGARISDLFQPAEQILGF